MVIILLVYLAVGAMFGFVGGALARSKRMGFGIGFVLGFFLGLLGLLIVAFMRGPRAVSYGSRRRGVTGMRRGMAGPGGMRRGRLSRR